MKLKNDMVNLIVRVEHHLCPLYCGVVDRRRIIAFLLLTISELIIIPYHIMLFLVMKESYGLSLCCLHTFVFCLLQFLVWKRKIAFVKGISSLYLLMFAKLALDSVFCINFGLANDNLSVISNLFVVFILAITALSQALYKTCTIITVGMIPMLLIYLFSIPLMSVLFSLKTIFLGFMMLVYVAVYNMSIVTKGLRQPKRMARVENKALNMLADLKDNQPEAAESLMKRLTPDVREKIITHASEHLFNEELDRVAWDQVCDGLTFSEKKICKLILQGRTLKEICAELNKSESNITSQRCHIRKKLNMDRRDDLRRTLEVRFYDAQKQVKKSEAENS